MWNHGEKKEIEANKFECSLGGSRSLSRFYALRCFKRISKSRKGFYGPKKLLKVVNSEEGLTYVVLFRKITRFYDHVVLRLKFCMNILLLYKEEREIKAKFIKL